MTCLGCASRAVPGERLCRPCGAGFTAGGDRRLPGGILVRSAFSHQGTARLLVLRLKYGGYPAAATVLAGAMAGCIPEAAGALVPVPRARLRRWRYGVDPAVELARALGHALSLPVVPALASEWWHRRRAGPAGSRRGLPRFRLVRAAPAGAILVDDVVTTGATLQAAAAALGGPCSAVTATTAPGGRRPPAAPADRGYSGFKPPPGDADDGRVCAAWQAPPPGPLLFPVCPPPLGRARRPRRRSRWRFMSAVSE